MVAIVEVLLTLALVVILLQKKVKMGTALLCGTGLLFVMCSREWATFLAAGKGLLFTPSTWEILLALYFVMCLEYQLRTSGIIDGLMTASRAIFRSDKALLAIMPAFLGFLPSLGGAIFSAPLVEAAGKPYQLSPERKTEINYWFRHVWECTNPILPALLLGSQIAQVPIGQLVFHMMWVSVICWLLGWFAYITPLKNRVNVQSEEHLSDRQPIGYRYVLLAAGPIIANFILVVGFDLGAALSMFLVVAFMTVILTFSVKQITAMLHEAFDKKMFWGIVNVLFFQYMLTKTGVMNEVAAVLQGSDIPLMVVVGLVGFISGLLTGTSQGSVAISFPLVAAVSLGDADMASIAYVASFSGQMLSPAHLCFLVTLDYFKADFIKSLRSIMLVAFGVLLVLSIKTTMHF